MIAPCLAYANTSIFSTHTGSPVSICMMKFAVSSAIRWRVRDLSCGNARVYLDPISHQIHCFFSVFSVANCFFRMTYIVYA